MSAHTVTAAEVGWRLDQLLTRSLGLGRSQAQRLIKAGQVTVDGRIAKPAQSLKAGQRVVAKAAVARPAEQVTPELPIIYQDDDVIVVDKPAGLLTHPIRPDDPRPSVASLLANQINDPDQLRPGIVHRLDRDTSGVMIVARSAAARRFLQQQFGERLVHKTYIALVVGHVDQSVATIQLPLAPSRRHPLKRQVAAGGKAATTEITVLERYPQLTLVEARPLTGRTHQLRVHLAMIGHPIVGDRLYDAPRAPRLFLHAHTLELTLPSGQIERFASPVPSQFRHYEQKGA